MHFPNMKQPYAYSFTPSIKMLAALCPLTFADVRMCLWAGWEGTRDRGLLGSACRERRFPKVELSQTALLSFCFRGEKSLSPACFVVSLKRFAAVSIKRHRSKETPPTEIPTEEGEEEEASGRLTDINIKDRR